MALTSTEQVALRALQEALAKVMDAQTLCVEAHCTGDQVVDNLLRAEGALAQAIRAFD